MYCTIYMCNIICILNHDGIPMKSLMGCLSVINIFDDMILQSILQAITKINSGFCTIELNSFIIVRLITRVSISIGSFE